MLAWNPGKAVTDQQQGAGESNDLNRQIRGRILKVVEDDGTIDILLNSLNSGQENQFNSQMFLVVIQMASCYYEISSYLSIGNRHQIKSSGRDSVHLRTTRPFARVMKAVK